MELVFFIMPCILVLSFSALLTPCTSLHIQLQPSNKQAAANDELQSSLPTLPRKLRFTEKVTIAGQEGKDSAPPNKQKENVSAAGGNDIKPKFQKEKESVQRSSGTWQEWMEGEDTSEFFTMDYSKVRRRRPIHNKSRPEVSP
ncbi:hypothetical protein PRUPE_1G293600 [Prunus persica]|uniref:Root meristem growth factor 8 n=1 Tax=Prunus persica TaxID=3760 RepID=A0A251R5Y8_PRUPE|nr:uncharacterized protein LOC18788633 [Prunus persica]ONI31120.1 hypothetical protein PRUPE_1G293600 [Prunus persica]